MKKTILVAILGVLLLTSNQKHPAKNTSVNKQKMALALNAQYHLGISPDLVLPFDLAGMALSPYLTNNLNSDWQNWV